jgi:HlyD family secretion protein
MEDSKMKPLTAPILLVAIVMLSCGDRNSHPQGSGLIEATEVTVSAETGGQLKAIYFDEGRSVAHGDTLAMIDTSTLTLHLRQAHAAKEAAATMIRVSSIGIKQAASSLELAEKEFERAASLIKSGTINQQQYDQANTAYDQARLAREQAEASYGAAQADLDNAQAQIDILAKQMSDCFPESPADGIVVNTFQEPGELIAPGRPLVKIAKLDTVWVKVYLPPADLTQIKLGSHAFVDPEDGRTRPLDGFISWISSEAEFTPKNVQTKEARAGLLYAVKITVPNLDQTLKIGMPVSVSIR